MATEASGVGLIEPPVPDTPPLSFVPPVELPKPPDVLVLPPVVLVVAPEVLFLPPPPALMPPPLHPVATAVTTNTDNTANFTKIQHTRFAMGSPVARDLADDDTVPATWGSLPGNGH